MDESKIKGVAAVGTSAAAVKHKPILKNDPQFQSTTSTSSPNHTKQNGDSKVGPATPNSKEKRHLKWDEDAIQEHDLLRGTRMKIDEPDTPYTHYDHHSDEVESNSSGQHPRSPDENHKEPELASQWDDIASKLQAVADKRDACPLSPAPSRDSNMSDSEKMEAEEKEKEEKKKKFKEMRKNHYNEAEMMRRWRMQHANDDEEEDEEEDDEDNAMQE